MRISHILYSHFHDKAELKSWLFKYEMPNPEDFPILKNTLTIPEYVHIFILPYSSSTVRVLFCRFIPKSLMLTLPGYDPKRYKWKSLGLYSTAHAMHTEFLDFMPKAQNVK